MTVTDKGHKHPLGHCAGFTLVEMLTVIVLICFLLGASALAVRKASAITRRTKAEAELRELVNAFLEFHVAYQGDTTVLNRLQRLGKTEVNRNVLEFVTGGNETKNPKGLVFLNFTMPENFTTYKDPWGHSYWIYFTDGSAAPKQCTEVETCVSFPYRRRNPLYGSEE